MALYQLFYWRSRCIHRSHWLRLRCWRPLIADGWCTEHHRKCISGCAGEPR